MQFSFKHLFVHTTRLFKWSSEIKLIDWKLYITKYLDPLPKTYLWTTNTCYLVTIKGRFSNVRPSICVQRPPVSTNCHSTDNRNNTHTCTWQSRKHTVNTQSTAPVTKSWKHTGLQSRISLTYTLILLFVRSSAISLVLSHHAQCERAVTPKFLMSQCYSPEIVNTKI